MLRYFLRPESLEFFSKSMHSKSPGKSLTESNLDKLEKRKSTTLESIQKQVQ